MYDDVAFGDLGDLGFNLNVSYVIKVCVNQPNQFLIMCSWASLEIRKVFPKTHGLVREF